MSMDIPALNARYGIPGEVSLTEQAGGMIVVEVSNPHADASIALQGAHLMTWTPRGAHPVIWLSEDARLAPGKSIRGGVPVRTTPPARSGRIRPSWSSTWSSGRRWRSSW